jgi:hypothetical protein
VSSDRGNEALNQHAKHNDGDGSLQPLRFFAAFSDITCIEERGMEQIRSIPMGASPDDGSGPEFMHRCAFGQSPEFTAV